jgi:Ni/Co efflux regulator RcnB
MRKLTLLALLAATISPIAAPVAAQAQTRELHRDRQDIREERRDLREAYRSGDRREIREEHRDLADARREYREDRRDWRDDHRGRYEGGRWNAPFAYHRWNHGARMGHGYYAPRYYINDYGRYRLRAPAYGARWVRHYDDVLLINIRTGRVLDVRYNFFW